MIKNFLIFLLIINFGTSAFADTITVSYSVADKEQIKGYRLYVSESADMSSKVLACEIKDPIASTMTCSIPTVQNSLAYLEIAAVVDGSEISSAPITYDTNMNSMNIMTQKCQIVNLRIISIK